MSAHFVFTEEAEHQLLDIIDHISAESEDAASAASCLVSAMRCAGYRWQWGSA